MTYQEATLIEVKLKSNENLMLTHDDEDNIAKIINKFPLEQIRLETEMKIEKAIQQRLHITVEVYMLSK